MNAAITRSMVEPAHGQPHRGPAPSALDPDAVLELVDNALDASAPSHHRLPEPIERLAAIFALTEPAAALLAVAVGAEVWPAVGDGLGQRLGSTRPTIDLAMRLGVGLVELGPSGSLRRWRLLEPSAGTYLHRELIPDQRIVDHALGVNQLDIRLEGLANPLRTSVLATPRTAQLADDLATVWENEGIGATIWLAGGDAVERHEIAAAAAEQIGHQALLVRDSDIPTDWTLRFGLATYLDREMALAACVTIIETAEHDDAVRGLVELMQGPVVVSSHEGGRIARRPFARLDIAAPAADERHHQWAEAVSRSALAARDDLSQVNVGAIAEQFALGRSEIDFVVGRVGRSPERGSTHDALWRQARQQSRSGLDALAHRIDSDRTWDDLVLPAVLIGQLKALVSEVENAAVVRNQWGWAERTARGLGTLALFAGPSGTGKTLAAEVIANEVALDLYRIDLSQVMSKWIGETEKNLAQIFDAAEKGGAVLLFDEADALFGKRTEVRDSHDRYANVEVSYLLQRMESYRGLAILTTNLRSTIDRAFMRRIRHSVVFPFPDHEQRAGLWSIAFPASTPTEGLDPMRLATLNLTGGSIHAVALNACFLAAADASPVRPEHVLVAARREFEKIEKPMSRAEMAALS